MLHGIEYGNGIVAIDSGFGRPWMDAVHAIAQQGRVALVDTAVNASVPRVMHSLAELGFTAEQVDYVFLTHIHLDHAGGAGELMRRLPNARLVVHPRGARHLIDPARLMAGTAAVYGDAAARRMYGEIAPIPAERIIAAGDGDCIALAGRELVFLETPGHARHHLCIFDRGSGHVFAGDTFGTAYRELEHEGRRHVFPITTPTQFDPGEMHRSIDRLMGLRPAAIYVTHFGQVRDIPRLAGDLHRLIDAHVAIGERHRGDGARRPARIEAELRELLLAEAARQAWSIGRDALLDLFAGDLVLNAQGIDGWLATGDRQ